MLGIDSKVVYHSITKDSIVKPIVERKCKLGGKNKVALNEQVKKFKNIGIIT